MFNNYKLTVPERGSIGSASKNYFLHQRGIDASTQEIDLSNHMYVLHILIGIV